MHAILIGLLNGNWRYTNGLLAHWRFNESIGASVAADATGSYHGTYSASHPPLLEEPSITPSDSGNLCAGFVRDGGYGDRVLMGNVLGFNDALTPFTVQFKLKAANVGTNKFVIAKQDATTKRGWGVYFDTTNRLHFILANTSGGTNQLDVYANTTTILDNVSRIITITYDGSKTPAGVKFWHNATLIANGITWNTLTGAIDTTAQLMVGGRHYTGVEATDMPFQGWLDDVKLYSGVRSDSDIAADYAAFS